MKWEYHTETTYSISDVDGSDAFKELFNSVMGTFERLGREDWELVSVDGGIAYFKRAIEEIPPAIVVVYSDHSQQAQETASEIRRHLRTDL